MAVIAALSKGYDLDYIWKQVDRGPAKDAASYYIQASENGESRQAGGGTGRRSVRLRVRPDGRAQAVRLAVRRARGPDGASVGSAAGP